MNTAGPRVDSRKDEGLFNKMARAKGYGWISAVGSGSGGLDLKDPRSNLDHSLTIGWLWWSGSVTGGVGRKWPSGHEIERGLALEHARGTRNALVAMGW